MLEIDDREDLKLRLAEKICEVEIPRSLQRRLSRHGSQTVSYDERRKTARMPFLTKTLLELTSTIRCIRRPTEVLAVLTVDVSRDGVAFLHVGQLFPGEVVSIWFPTGKQACRVTRCLKHNPKCFEVGAAFESGPQPAAWLRALRRDQRASAS